jgi:hypothetical protein
MSTFTCPHCSQSHPAGARFCPVTGLLIDQKPAVTICPSCKREIQTGWSFCPYCIPARSTSRWWPLKIVIFAVLLISGAFVLWTTFGDTDNPLEIVSLSGREMTIEASVTPSSTVTNIPPSSTVTASPMPTQSPTATLTITATITPSATPTITPSATPTIWIADTPRGEGIVTAYFLANPPEIDGNLQDWSLPFHSINAVVYGRENHEGLTDVSALNMLGWNDVFLFIAVQVRDDRYIQNASGEMLYQGDHIEILLDKGGEKSAEKLTSNHYQLGLSLGADLKTPEYHLWYPVSKRGSIAAVELAGTRASDGYILEAKIPWEIFGGKPITGQPYGFSISVGDNDDQNRNMMKSLISSAPKRQLTIPSTWGTLYLE